MTMNYASEEAAPTQAEVDAWTGAAVIEFGTGWCGYCRAAQPVIEQAFAAYPDVRRVKVEDGKGRALGRAYGVKLWPTLVFLQDGKAIAKLVRPGNADAIENALSQLGGAD